MSDSIAGTVTAIICVVVGLLIIGCALVPIVQHASNGTETTETITGSNEVDGGGLVILIKSNHTVTLDEGILTIDNKATQYDIDIINNYFQLTSSTAICKIEPISITIYGDDTQKLRSGTVALTPSQAVITGLDYDDPDQSYSNTITLTNAVLSSSDSATIETIAPPTEVYGNMMTATIGDGQTAIAIYGDPNDPTTETITTNTQSSPGSAVTLTKNDNGTVTIAIDPNGGMLFAPIGWSQTVTTAGESSQYAALYGIIPIMCILGMAYVLIRRF